MVLELSPESATGSIGAMIGGAPYLMAPLEEALRAADVVPMYAYSERVSKESASADGTVVKTNIFKHVGFVVCDA
jgi:hypothetical protein